MQTYQNMKDSGVAWLGDVPSEWNIYSVKWVLDRKIIKNESENPVVLSLARAGVKIRDMSTNKGQLAESYLNYNVVNSGDVLLNPMDLISGANCSISKVNGVISPAYVNLRPKKDYNSQYLDYYFKLQYWSNTFFVHGKGVSYINRWTLSVDTILNYPVPVPDSITQKRIADYLDKETAKIDNLISKQENLLKLLEEKRKSTISRTVTKGLKIGLSLKPTTLLMVDYIPAKWKVIALKRIANIYGRIGFRGYTTNDIVDENEGAITLSPSNIVSDELDLTKKVYVSWKKYDESLDIQIHKDDIIFVKTGSTIGKVAYIAKLSEPMTLNPQLIVIKDIKILSEFLAYAMRSGYFKDQILSQIEGGSTPSINQEKINSTYIIIPPENEQEEIVRYLHKIITKINELKIKINKELELLKERRVSLISNVVTGKIKI